MKLIGRHTITVQVTDRHIANGHKSSCSFCPVALALTEVGWRGIVVGTDSFAVDSGALTIPLPKIAQDFISDFDHDRPVKPFDFEIPVTTALWLSL